MAKDKMHLIINILLFQCTWFALVMGPLMLGASLLLCLLLHSVAVSNNRKALGMLCAVVVFLGVLTDSILMNLDIYQLQPAIASYEVLIPAWLVLLWLAFALTLKRSLNWLFDFPWLMVLMLGALGPLSYYAGSQLNPDRIEINHRFLPVAVFQWTVIGFVIIGSNKMLFNNCAHKMSIK
ncbi:DUF2878 domain-containing protein [Pseudomonas sp. HK3]|jgi:hypothetical protein